MGHLPGTQLEVTERMNKQYFRFDPNTIVIQLAFTQSFFRLGSEWHFINSKGQIYCGDEYLLVVNIFLLFHKLQRQFSTVRYISLKKQI